MRVAVSLIEHTRSTLFPFSITLSYVWTDPTDLETTNSTYIFNVCENVINQPASCPSPVFPAGPAFQITNIGGYPICYSLGYDLTHSKIGNGSLTWGLVDPTDPSRGVALTYLSPEPDNSCPGNIPRTFTLEFGCSKDTFPGPGQSSNNFIDEVDICNYRAHSWSTAGCPLRKCTRL